MHVKLMQLRCVQVQLIYSDVTQCRVPLHGNSGTEIAGMQVHASVWQLEEDEHRSRAADVTNKPCIRHYLAHTAD